MIYTPLGNRILVELIKESERMDDGIIIPQTALEDPKEAMVIRLGVGRVTKDGKPVTFNVKVGDKILLRSDTCGTRMQMEMDDYNIVEPDDIVAILED